MFDYTTQRSRAPVAKVRSQDRRLQNFIVCHAEINNKTDLISYDLYNIFPLSRLEDTCRVYKYNVSRVSVCMHKLRVSLSGLRISQLRIYVCTCVSAPRVCSSRVSLRAYMYVYITRLLSPAAFLPRARRPSQNSLPYIQYVKIYRLDYIVVSTVKKFYTFSLEYRMQSDHPQNDLRRSKANPNPRNASETTPRSTSSIGHAMCASHCIITRLLPSLSP